MARMGQTTSAPTETARRPGRRTPPGAGQRADAVPRAGADPLAGLQHRAPVVLLELRAARLVPRHRHRLPGQPAQLVADPRRRRCCWPCWWWACGCSRSRSTAPAPTSSTSPRSQATGPPAWLVLPLVFVVVALVIAGPAEIVGRCFAEPDAADGLPLGPDRLARRHRPASRCCRSSGRRRWCGASIVAVAFVVLVPNLKRVLAIARRRCWSWACCWSRRRRPAPAGRRTTRSRPRTSSRATPTFVDISVNGVPHQLMAPAQWKLEQGEQQYATPYLRIKDNSLDDVLVVGAGSGSDVAIALSKGATHVDAVDIDPRIMQIGVERNPDRAYQNPRVTRHVNDGRAFLPVDGQEVRPDPLRAARLADAGQRRLADPARVVPVHRPGDRGGPRAPQARRRVRDVQLLPRGLADRPAGRHRRRRLRAHARAWTPSPAPRPWSRWPATRPSSSARRRTSPRAR